MQLELEIWREACRHLDIQESLARMLPVLARHLPVSAIAIRRVDVARSRVETVAIEGAPPAELTKAPLELGAAALDRMLAVFGEREPWRTELDPEDPVFGPRDARASGDTIVAPLLDDEGPQGVLALFAERTFTREHVALAASIIEPIAIALANDQRVHELAQLREAALAENRALLTRLNRRSIVESIVGERGGLRSVIERVAQVARTDVPVLVLGETGSGKELIARAIHERSARSLGPMVRVNCGAIPPDLVDSELFGHERGSFTGAVASRKGWFERADGGTLLLDEVGELPHAAQVRLLRILQEGTLERVGAQRTIHVDVRIVAATHRDLHRMVAERTFREDLWYRLSVFPMRLPALRERLEDLPALAAHFAGRAGERLGAGPLAPTQDDLRLLLGYAWPGNVRELATVIERAAILGHGRKLEVAAALGAGSAAAARTPAIRADVGAEPILAVDALRAREAPGPLDSVVVAHIERVLAEHRGRIEGPRGAALALGVNPHTLRSKMRKLGIDWARHRRA